MSEVGRYQGLTLDSGAFLALERRESRIRALLREALDAGLALVVPAGVLAQVWRGGARQVQVARLLADVTVVPLDKQTACVVGELCGRSGRSDVVDVSVALCARERGFPVVTSDPVDIRAVHPPLPIIKV